MSIEETTKQEIAANEADEPVAMEAYTDWAEAVKNVAKQYTCKKIAVSLLEA